MVVHQGVRWSYAQFAAEVDRVARALVASGLAPGDRVGIWAPNCAEWVLVQYATAKAGAILVNINPAYETAELSYALQPVRLPACSSPRARSRPRTTRPWSSRGAARAVPTLERTSFLDSPIGTALLATPAARRTAALPLASLAVRRPDQHPVHVRAPPAFPRARRCRTTTSSTTASSSARRCGYTERDRVCIPVPFYHCFGMVLGNLACTTHGACMVIPAKAFEPLGRPGDRPGRALHRALRRADHVHRRARPSPTSPTSTCRTLRTGIMAGSPCPVEVMQQGHRAHAHARGHDLLRHDRDLAGVDPDQRRRRPRATRVGTVGRVHPHVEIKIVDPATGRVVPRGEPGELCTRGYSVMLGYWNNPEATAAGHRRAPAGCTPATWPRWTTTATSTSSGASRT